MRTLFVIVLAAAALGCGNPSGACENTESASCVNVPQRACEPMVNRGAAVFHASQTCEALGFTVCTADGCRRP